jgi:hypothetical protein
MVFCFLPHTECAEKKKLKLGQNKKLGVVDFKPICMPTICFLKILKFWFFYECFKILRRAIFKQALSMRAIIFTVYSVYEQ